MSRTFLPVGRAWVAAAIGIREMRRNGKVERGVLLSYKYRRDDDFCLPAGRVARVWRALAAGRFVFRHRACWNGGDVHSGPPRHLPSAAPPLRQYQRDPETPWNDRGERLREIRGFHRYRPAGVGRDG